MMNLTGTSLSNTGNSLFDTGTFSLRRQHSALTVRVIRHGPPPGQGWARVGREERPTTCGRVALKLHSVLPDQRVCPTQSDGPHQVSPTLATDQYIPSAKTATEETQMAGLVEGRVSCTSMQTL